MDITSKPNLKPLRQYDEYDVIPFFAHASGSANKGSLVKLSVADGNTNVFNNANDPVTPYLNSNAIAGIPSRATALRYDVAWKVDTATSGNTAIGMLLYDVRETNDFGEKYIYRPRVERTERDIVVSGEAVPIVTRGLFTINGFVGTPGPGSGAKVSTASGGYFEVTATTTGVSNVGRFLTSADADGYALFKLEL